MLVNVVMDVIIKVGFWHSVLLVGQVYLCISKIYIFHVWVYIFHLLHVSVKLCKVVLSCVKRDKCKCKT
jgi:hypothetical protein